MGGWHDSELTELGRRQAAAVAARIAALVEGADDVEIHSSDLRRAVQTAGAIAARLGREVTYWPELREISYGAAEGQPQSWLAERLRPPPPGNGRLDHAIGVAGAETRRAFLTRIHRAMDQIVDRPCRAQVIVTHGFALTGVVSAWIGLPVEAAGRVHFRSESGAITHLHEDDLYHNRSLERLSDTTHLAEI